MSSDRNLSAYRWSAGFSWYAVLLLLLLTAFPRTATGEEPSGPPMVVLGTLESTSIKYQGVGKSTGAAYKGTARVRVLEILGGKDRQPSGVAVQQILVLCVEERHKKPTWETNKGQDFIFVLEPITGTTQFQALDVASSDQGKLRRIRESGKLSREGLGAILHPVAPK